MRGIQDSIDTYNIIGEASMVTYVDILLYERPPGIYNLIYNNIICALHLNSKGNGPTLDEMKGALSHSLMKNM